MTEQLVLRPAALADGPAVIALWKSCGLVADYNPPMADFERVLAAPACDVILAETEDGLLGSVMVGDDGHRGWIYYLAVAPSAQGRGLGRRLTEAAEAWASDRGVRKIQLMIRPSNAPVREFYNSAGYSETPRLVMAKWLDKEIAANPPEDRS